jgi:hypothetical protein
MTSTEDLIDIAEDVDEIESHEWTDEELWRVPSSPGKFEGEPILTRVLFEYALNGMEDNSISFGDGQNYDLFSDYHIGKKGPRINAILITGSGGFVQIQTMDNNRLLMERWKEIEKAAEKEARAEEG